MPSATPLPAVNARVDIWFDGYDEYYPGRVDRIAGPDEFHVVLDDGTEWNIDTRKHVFKLSGVPATRHAPGEQPDHRPRPDPDQHPQAQEQEQEQEHEQEHEQEREQEREQEAEPTTPTEAPIPQQSGKPLSADVPSPPQRRRTSGRALRKSAIPRPDADYQPETPPPVRRSTRVEAASSVRPGRPGRPRRRVAEDVAPSTPPHDRAQRAARRTRIRQDEHDVEPVPKKPRKVPEPNGKAREKPPRVRKPPEVDDREKQRDAEGENDVREQRVQEREKENQRQKDIITRVRDEYGLEGLSTKAVTAIAVDAALQSAKAVLSPLNERLESLVKEVVEIGKIAMRATEAAESRKRAPIPPSAVTAAALENFQLDVSEIIGGGEARIKAYSGMSDQEFEALHRVIDAQGKALKEIDRLLYAAQEFGKRAKEAADKGENSKEKEANGDKMDVDNGAEKANSAPTADPEAATAK